MAVLHDYYCEDCERIEVDKWSPPSCCGHPMKVAFRTIHTPEWGSPRTYLHLRDEPFYSRGELNKWARENGMALGASAEKHGGARNEEHLNVGKKYSYKGAPRR